uniref:Uncharacterized protein n=1 Tax=Arundo donax TaxID=35708 RepID=A0A0A9FAW2_ARUDO
MIWRSTAVDGGNLAARFGAPQRWRGGSRPAPTKLGGSPRLEGGPTLSSTEADGRRRMDRRRGGSGAGEEDDGDPGGRGLGAGRRRRRGREGGGRTDGGGGARLRGSARQRRWRLDRGPIWRSTAVDGGNPAARFAAPQRW